MNWYFIVGSIMKINSFQSRSCVRFYTTWSCTTYNTIFADAGGAAIVGGGFIGMIRKIKVFEYPKIEFES